MKLPIVLLSSRKLRSLLDEQARAISERQKAEEEAATLSLAVAKLEAEQQRLELSCSKAESAATQGQADLAKANKIIAELRSQRETLRAREAIAKARINELTRKGEASSRREAMLGQRLHKLREERRFLQGVRAALEKRVALLTRQRAALLARDRRRAWLGVIPATPPAPDDGPDAVSRDEWSDPARFDRRWDARTVVVSDMLGGYKAVCEIGCGPHQLLRELLPKEVKYLPADLVRWTEDTVKCDLNNYIFPETYLKQSDICALIGVMEYVIDEKKVIKIITKNCKDMVFTYHPTDITMTRHANWRSHLSMAELRSIISECDCTIISERRFGSQMIVLIRRRECAADETVNRPEGTSL